MPEPYNPYNLHAVAFKCQVNLVILDAISKGVSTLSLKTAGAGYCQSDKEEGMATNCSYTIRHYVSLMLSIMHIIVTTMFIAWHIVLSSSHG